MSSQARNLSILLIPIARFHPGKGLIPFKTRTFKQILDDLALHRFIVVLKARQLGISTITAAYVAWLVLFIEIKTFLLLQQNYKLQQTWLRK